MFAVSGLGFLLGLIGVIVACCKMSAANKAAKKRATVVSDSEVDGSKSTKPKRVAGKGKDARSKGSGGKDGSKNKAPMKNSKESVKKSKDGSGEPGSAGKSSEVRSGGDKSQDKTPANNSREKQSD